MKKKIIKPTKLEVLSTTFATYKENAQKFMYTLQNPPHRALLSVDAADAQGKLNGMTIVELLLIVNLTDAQGERVYLKASGKTITAVAEKKAPRAPMELL
jgi:hypothetical protein